jgi:hypothetical protein
MRSTLLTRSVMAVASLAIGSVALAAVPASAATPSGSSREDVLSLAASARADGNVLSPATRSAAAAILNRECGLQAPRVITGNSVRIIKPVGVDATVDGLFLNGLVRDADGEGTPVGECAIGVVAARESGAVLTGNATLSTSTPVNPLVTTPATSLSSDVSSIVEKHPAFYTSTYSFKAGGAAAKTTTTIVTEKVKVTKTAAEKKAAEKKYDKRLKAIKKSYKKALAKAGKSKAKKVHAKKSYKAKRTSAKSRYRAAVAASFKLVKKSVDTTDSRQFAVTAEQTSP